MAKEIDVLIQENAEGPKSAKSSDVSASQHNLKDLIEADRYIEGKRASKTGLGFKMTIVKSPAPL